MNQGNEIENLVKDLNASYDLASYSDQEFIRIVEKRVKLLARQKGYSLTWQVSMVEDIYSSLRGYDVLDQLLADPTITEIMVNAYDEIFFERSGQLFRSNLAFASKEKYENVLFKIVSDAGREVHQRTPIVDCRMDDGSRVNVVLHPIASKSHILTIRKFFKKKLLLEDLVENNTLSKEAGEFLKLCVQTKCNIFISGGTGSGKTTLLNALAAEIDPRERLISIEDARELNFEDHDNWVALETKKKTASGETEISIRDLIRTSLRMRPDRIIVGEVRGEETLDMLQAMNTGHEGSLSTGHANSILEMQSRLETMVLSGNSKLPLSAIRVQIGQAFDYSIHLGRQPDGTRKVLEIAEVILEKDEIYYHPIFLFEDRVLKRKNEPKNTKRFKEWTLSADYEKEETLDAEKNLS